MDIDYGKNSYEIVAEKTLQCDESLALDRDLFFVAAQLDDKKYKKAIKKPNNIRGESLNIKNPFGNGITIHKTEMSIIENIITYMDSKSTFNLGWPSNQRFLKEEGEKIDHVHPLCFIWTIVSNPSLRSKLKSFRDDSAFSLKWNGFLGYSPFHNKGFGKNMEKFYNHKQPQEYLHEFEAFYKALGLKPDVMNSFAIRKEWKEFASALLEKESYY